MAMKILDYVVVACYLFVSRVGHKQCAAVASDRALDEPSVASRRIRAEPKPKKLDRLGLFFGFGEPGGTRTHDTKLKRLVL